MKRLITILRAAHCRSTHHFFAVDALPLVDTSNGRRLANLLLQNYERYLIGAKDPDKTFKDFRNHVLHVADGGWGGAAKSAQHWYHKLIERLDAADWSEAAYAAGVLSHYFTDPLMPLHTAQSKRESIVHRPLEWSVTKSYDRILNRWQQGQHQVIFEIARHDGWLAEAVTRGAEVAHRHYDELVGQYDLKAGSKRPTEGLDQSSIDSLAGMFGIAITGWARILERAAEDTHAVLPDEPLRVAELVATIKLPLAWIIRRIQSHTEQKAVRAIFAELQQTGRVKKNLPEEVVCVRAERERDRQQARRSSIEPRSVATESLTTLPAAGVDAPAKNSSASPAAVVSPTPDTSSKLIPISPAAPPSPRTTDRQPRLNAADNLVDAPSIGPKTAKRFAAIGITTVAQFLAASPAQLEAKLDTRWISEEKLRQWQDQAQLVCEVPSLCGYKSQLLVGVGCRSSQALAAEQAAALHTKIDEFAKTSAGKRALRSSQVPSRDEVTHWIRDAAAMFRRRTA